jgi:hypothetical protein
MSLPQFDVLEVVPFVRTASWPGYASSGSLHAANLAAGRAMSQAS